MIKKHSNTLCLEEEWNKHTLFTFLTGLPQPTSLPTSLYPRNLNYKDDKSTFNVDIKDYISKAVSDTQVNILDVFIYEFPTHLAL